MRMSRNQDFSRTNLENSERDDIFAVKIYKKKQLQKKNISKIYSNIIIQNVITFIFNDISPTKIFLQSKICPYFF